MAEICMIKIKLPYSTIFMLVMWGFSLPVWSIALVGGLVEFAGGGIVLYKLGSGSKFEYNSFVGGLLQQFTIVDHVSMFEIQTLVGFRLAACALLGCFFPNSWVYIPAIVLYLFSAIHIVPKKKARRK